LIILLMKESWTLTILRGKTLLIQSLIELVINEMYFSSIVVIIQYRVIKSFNIY